MLVEVTKRETHELKTPHYSKIGSCYTFVSVRQSLLEVTHCYDGSVIINSKSPDNPFYKSALERAIEGEEIEAEEFEVKFCEALTKVGQQLGLDPINLKAV